MLLATIALALPAAPAAAEIAPTRTASELGAAIDNTGGAVTGASFVLLPSDEGGIVSPAARSDVALASFPTHGPDYAILTNGQPDGATLPSSFPISETFLDPDARGAMDVTVLRVDLAVPGSGANCLSVDYRFLTEETSENGSFWGVDRNDAFLAELDVPPEWSFDPADWAIAAPRNFAWGPTGGFASSWNGRSTTLEQGLPPAGAAGTSYDAATMLDTASVPVTPGAHSLYLSIFDGDVDGRLDSAAFVDNLRLTTSAACGRGRDTLAPAPAITSLADGDTVGTRPTVSGTAGTDLGDHRQVHVKTWFGDTTAGDPALVVPVQPTAGAWSGQAPFDAAPGRYTSVVEQRDDAGNVGRSAPVTFTVAAPPVVGIVEPSGAANDATPRFSGYAGTETGDSSTVTLSVWSGEDTIAAPLHTAAVTHTDGSWAHEFAATLADGTYTARVEQRNDDNGFVGRSENRAFTIDTAAPAAPVLTAPDDGATVATRRPAFSGTAALAPGDTLVEIEVWTGTDTTGAPLFTQRVGSNGDGSWETAAITAIANGGYSWRAVLRDEAGNAGASAVRTFTVAAAPELRLDQPSPNERTGDLTPEIAGSASTFAGDLATITVKLYRGTDTSGAVERTLTTTVEYGGVWTVVPDTALPRGVYTAQAEQADDAGRVGRSNTVTFRVLGAFVDNGTVQLGINEEGHLNLPGAPRSSGGTPVMGIRYVPTNAEATGPGCECEGWGVADATTGTAGYANQARGGVVNLAQVSFTATPSTAVSVVEVPGPDGPAALRVTHDYHPSSVTPNLYEVDVTVENLSASAVDLRYRRVMDWDVEPTAFSEFVTLERGTATDLVFTSDDGFAGANPLRGPSSILFTGEAVDSGPSDHGALFDFGFGSLAAGATKSFETFYGAAGSEAQATAALEAVGAEAYSLGQPNTDLDEAAGKPLAGTPNTFIFAFRGVGGAPVFDEDTPVLTLDTPAGGARTSDVTPAFSGVAGTASGDEAQVTVDVWSGTGTAGDPLLTLTATRDEATGAYSVSPSAGLTDGTYTARAKQSDGAGNTGTSAARTFTVDTTAPAVTLEAPAAGSSTSDATPTFAGTGGTATGDSATVTVDVHEGSTATGLPVLTLSATRDPVTGAYSADASSALAPGTYTARARQSDAADNTGFSSPTTFTVSSGQVPTVTLDQPAPGSVTNEAAPEFTGTAGTAAGDAATVTVKVYEGVLVGGPLSITLSATVEPGGFWSVVSGGELDDGTYTAQAEQVGAGGTGMSAATTFRVDKVAPVVTLEEPADGASTADTTPAFSGAAGIAPGDGESVMVRVYRGVGTDGPLAASFVTARTGATWAVTPSAGEQLSPGTYTAVAVQADEAGGEGVSAAHTFTITGPPMVAILSPGDDETLTESLPTFFGSAGTRDGDAATVTLDLWQGEGTAGAPFRTLTGTQRDGDWAVRPGTPLPNGRYSARATQASDVGTGVSEVVRFTIAAPAELASAGPLTRIRTTTDLGCAVDHIDDAAGEFYGDFACGTLVVVGDLLFGPGFIPAGGGASPRTPFTPVSQTVSGTGTAADPLTIVTVVDAGDTGVRVTQRDTYVIGEESYRTDVRLANTGASERAAKLYRAADCYLQDSDVGYGEVDPATGAVACKTAPDPVTGSARIEQWFPLSPGSHYFQAGYSEVWAQIGQQLDFPDTCRCDAQIDNGAGLSWAMTLAAGETASRAHLTTFSPAGRQPLTMTKTADDPSTPAGGENGYAITIRNRGDSAVSLSTVTDDLPAGFVYVPGTTTGATTANPSVAGGTLTWSGIAVPANGEATIRFRVTVAGTPGEYLNEADAVATGPAVVVGTGPTAPVTVTTADTTAPNLVLERPEDGSLTNDATPTFSGVAGTAAGDQAAVTVEVRSGAGTAGPVVATLSATRDPGTGAFSIDAAAELPDGMYTAQASQRDGAGNTGTSAPRTFRVDTTRPTITLDAVPARTKDATPTFSGAAGTATGDMAEVTVKVWQGSTTAGAPFRTVPATRDPATGAYTIAPAVTLPDGQYTARAEQVDAAGNTGTSAERTFTADTAAPTVTLTAPADGSSSDDTTPAFAGTAGDATGDSVTVVVKVRDSTGSMVRSLDATRSGTSFSIDAAPALSPGTYTAWAEQTDDLGNGPGLSNTRTFTVLRSAPVVTLAAPANGSRIADATPTFSGTAGNRSGDADTVAVDVFAGTGTSGTPLYTVTASRSGTTWTGDLTEILSDGVYTARARQTQDAGPAGASAAHTFTVDKTPPAVTLTAPADGSSSEDRTPRFAGAAGNAAGDSAQVTVEVFEGDTAAGALLHTLNVTPVGAGWSGDLVDELASGTYTARARQSDDLGNSATTAERTFIVTSVVPTVSAVTLTAPANGSRTRDSTPGLAGTASGPGPVTVEIFAGATASGTRVQTRPATRSGGTFAATASTLRDGTYTARAALGTARSAPRTFTVDTTAPRLSLTAPAAGSVTRDATPRLAGAAGTATGDGAAITVTVRSGSVVVRTLTATRSGAAFAVDATPLLPDGMYTAQASQADDLGNRAQSNTRTFRIETADVGELDVPKSVKRSHLFCERGKRCKGLVGSAEFLDVGTAVWELTVTYTRGGRTRTALVAALKQAVAEPGTEAFKLAAVGKKALLRKLKGARKIKLTLELTFTDADGNRTVRTTTLKLKA